MANPRCPRCSAAGLKTKSEPVPGDARLFRCNACFGLHDGDPNEGGTYHDRDVSRRLEREEEALKRRLGGGPIRRIGR